MVAFMAYVNEMGQFCGIGPELPTARRGRTECDGKDVRFIGGAHIFRHA
jgi:hypothetical protein